ncbi:SDR family NAD(P)-dependent oxidoreductase [Hymenobacter psychrotolerans]|uniref:NAD(P)-dependent dehydrogenase, short-chain alcohol dehydrogenase family n=1 Tax=Hymenobacter psychrotolerans DSM 18569 TaxID=1121959 RepID=A0A1M6P634_9BACT|nr:SDR family oxidoreductase [Hymenobacter psychrotolerans]SHK03336.1 NAD(P)-dependent dehydrogenase, short-chain alcohol dehydrogenase family [Hymenobacter psychrotolerans DSM 18569]
MRQRFQNKVCFVTGGTSGIGRAVAVQLAQEGGLVAIIGRDTQEGREVVREIAAAGGTAKFIRTDIGRDAQLVAAVGKTLAVWKKIDVLVCNAGMMTFEPLLKLAPKSWDTLFQVNVRSLFRLTQLCLPHMKHGSIVAVSSVHAHQTTPNVIPYAASKGAIEAFVRGLSQEIPHTHARINAVAPGAVDTPLLWSNPNVKSGKEKITGQVGTPEELSAAICFLASSEANFINGTTLVADGGRLATL